MSGKGGHLAYHPAELAKYFEPAVRTGGVLRPPRFFDHPLLKARPDNITDALADRCVDGHVGKATSGLNHKYRANGAEVRRAFRECRFQGRVLSALEWAVPGMREDQMVRFLATCGLAVKEIAEGFRALFGDGALDYANHINQLAEGRLHPTETRVSEPWLLPGHVSIPLGYDALLGGMAPAALFAARPGEPHWTALPAENLVIVSLGNLHYHLDADDLRRASALTQSAALANGGLGPAQPNEAGR